MLIRDDCLHMFSGGRDSLLSASLMIEQGFVVHLITYDNGHIGSIERVSATAKLLKEKYHHLVDILPVVKTGMTMNEFAKDGWYMTGAELNQYPTVQMYQLNCLFCKIAMFVHTIAYCNATEKIHYISDGTRKCQGFYVDSPSFQQYMSEICKKNEITLMSPMYFEESDSVRKCKLSERDLPTKTLEPQCYLGCPICNTLTNENIRDLDKFFIDKIEPKIQPYINQLTVTKRCLLSVEKEAQYD